MCKQRELWIVLIISSMGEVYDVAIGYYILLGWKEAMKWLRSKGIAVVVVFCHGRLT